MASRFALSSYTVTVPFDRAAVRTEHITPPPDRRHKWVLVSETDARRWFRCSACGKRRSVRSLVSLLGQRMEDASRALQDHMNVHLFGRRRPERSDA